MVVCTFLHIFFSDDVVDYRLPKIALLISPTTIRDLDQMAALLLSGLFVLLGTILNVLLCNWEDIRKGISIPRTFTTVAMQCTSRAFSQIPRLSKFIEWL